MSIFQFLRILWAGRLIILATTISCLIGAAIVVRIVPPRWDGTARVMLNILKPDPVTGMVVGGIASKNYIATQVALINDYSVTGKVAEQLGWLSDPGLINAYRHRSKTDTADFRHWLAAGVSGRASADVILGSNIMQIHYSASRPEEARAVSEALRRAYMDVSLSMQREDATRDAEWYTQQTEKAKAALDTAMATLADYERQNGIVMADNNTDVDTARLRTLAQAGDVNVPTVAPVAASPLRAQLASVDSDIVEQSKTLGPNHPTLIALRAKRTAIAQLITQEESNQASQVAKANALRAGAVQQALNVQKSKVIAQSAQRAKLTQLQAEVDLRRQQFDRTQTKAADLRLQAASNDAGMTSLGTATVPAAPSFPKKPLIYLGALGLGLGMGFALALLVELFARKVRSPEDLRYAVDAPTLAVIAGAGRPSDRSLARRLPRQVNWPIRRKAVQG
jgi:uncharacterized protein involved in exopolysaccharide biosynthesis